MALRARIERLSEDLRAQKLRSSLTILGITWGTVAVVVLLAFGVGFEKQMRKNMHGVGDGIVIIFGGRTTKPFEGFGDGRTIQLREDDVSIILREVPGIGAISPEYSERATPVRRGKNSATPNITGVYPDYGDMRNVIAARGGRFLNALDVAQRRRVAVLGDEVAALLFGEEDPIGKKVFIGRVPVTVVGVMVKKEQNSSYNSRDKDRVFIPASTHRALFGRETVSNIIYKPADPMAAAAVKQGVSQILARKHRFDPADEDAVEIWDTAEFDKFIGAFFIGFNLFMGIVGSFTLTVGGIGVANIMYVVVRERTREIGVRRSIGASRRDILRHFLAEAFLIVFMGAALGFLISAGIVALLQLIPIKQFIGAPIISPVVAIATALLLCGVALLAGFFPARRASLLDPVESLRYGS